MPDTLLHIAEHFKGSFIASPQELREKLFSIKAFVFDWDGVFNNGMKDENGSSPFSEVDAMGTNLLRFNHYLRNQPPPVVAIISGEKNRAAFSLSVREHFHAAYYGIKYKATALQHLCEAHKIKSSEVAFMMDDVLDFSLAEKAGLRIMVNRRCNPMLMDYAVRHNLVEYITAADGSEHAVREAVEMLTAISGLYEDTITDRMHFTETYQEYLTERNQAKTLFYTIDAKHQIIQKLP